MDKVKYTPLTPISSDSQLRKAVNDIIANLSPLTGQHRVRENKAVTWLDLVAAGYEYSFDGNGDFVMPSPVKPEQPDMSTPPEVEGFRADSSFNYVTLSWEQPKYKNHSHVEVWRAEGFLKGGAPTTLDDAVFRAMSTSIVASDTVLPADIWRYWARNVSKEGVFGPWTSVDGLLVNVPASPSYIIDKISGEIREGDLYPALGDKINIAYDGYFANSARIDDNDITLASHTATLSSHGVAIQQQMQIITDQGRLINAAYTVRIDTGNAVHGFGLMADGSTGRSDFLIRSDRFAICAPQQYDQNGRPIKDQNSFPFIVDVSNPASPKTLIRNAYIDKAFIESLVTGTLVADRVTGQTLVGTHIRGGDMVIGANFSVDTAGSATLLNAFFKGTAQSSNYAAGNTGWQIRNDGYAEFRQAVVRGTVYADAGYFNGTVYADKMVGHITAAAVKSCQSHVITQWRVGDTLPLYSFNVASNASRVGVLSVIGGYVPLSAGSTIIFDGVYRTGGFVLCCRAGSGSEVVFSSANDDVTVALPAGFSGEVKFYYKAMVDSGVFATCVVPYQLDDEGVARVVPFNVTGILTYNYGGLS